MGEEKRPLFARILVCFLSLSLSAFSMLYILTHTLAPLSRKGEAQKVSSKHTERLKIPSTLFAGRWKSRSPFCLLVRENERGLGFGSRISFARDLEIERKQRDKGFNEQLIKTGGLNKEIRHHREGALFPVFRQQRLTWKLRSIFF